MKMHKARAIFWSAAAGLSLILSASGAAAQCQGQNCEREEHKPPPREAPPQNRPAAPPQGQRPGGAPQPGGGSPGINGAYRQRGPTPQEGYRPNPAPQPVDRHNPYYQGGGSAAGGHGRYASPGGQAGAPSYSATHRFTYQGRSFAAVRAAPYHYPRGYGYRQYHSHERFPLALLVAPYFIADFGFYNLPPPGPDLQWVRYGPDALLVNVDTGEVVDVAYGVFEEDAGYAYNQGPGENGGPDYPPPDENGPPPGYQPGGYPPGGYPPGYQPPDAPYGYPPSAPPYGYPPPGGPQG